MKVLGSVMILVKICFSGLKFYRENYALYIAKSFYFCALLSF